MTNITRSSSKKLRQHPKQQTHRTL